jgi:hypothetical protein
VTSAELAPRRLASSHHNIIRFALKCLPPAAAARVVVGELIRWPRYPAAIGGALARIAFELPEIARLRRALGSSRRVFDAMLAGEI